MEGVSIRKRRQEGLNTDKWTITINATASFAIAPPSIMRQPPTTFDLNVEKKSEFCMKISTLLIRPLIYFVLTVRSLLTCR